MLNHLWEAGPPMSDAIRGHLRDSKLFRNLSEAQLDLFLPLCRLVTVDKDAPIFQEQEEATHLCVVGKGRVALTMRLERPDGSVTPSVTVASCGPGDAFGWSSIVEPRVLTLSSTTVEPSELVFIEGQPFLTLLAKHTRLGYPVMVNIAHLLSGRLAELREAFVYEHSWLLREKQRPETD